MQKIKDKSIRKINRLSTAFAGMVRRVFFAVVETNPFLCALFGKENLNLYKKKPRKKVEKTQKNVGQQIVVVIYHVYNFLKQFV